MCCSNFSHDNKTINCEFHFMYIGLVLKRLQNRVKIFVINGILNMLIKRHFTIFNIKLRIYTRLISVTFLYY
jgi:hypothetical protein